MKFDIKSIIPIFEWLPNYKRSQFKNDISAGITLGAVLIPQGMAYGMLAGMPPIYGLYAALVPTLIYLFLGSNRILAVGPVALDSLILASGLGVLKLGSEGAYIAMALMIALFVGLIQLSMGLLKLGFLVSVSIKTCGEWIYFGRCACNRSKSVKIHFRNFH